MDWLKKKVEKNLDIKTCNSESDRTFSAEVLGEARSLKTRKNRVKCKELARESDESK